MTNGSVRHRQAPPRLVAQAHESLVREMGRFRIPEGTLGFALVFIGVAVPGLPIAFPVSYLAAILIIVVAVNIRPRYVIPSQAWMPFLLLLCGLIFTTAVSALAGYSEPGEWGRRLIRVLSVVGMVLVLATGRLDLWSVLRGYLLGLVFNVPMSYLGMVPGSPEGFLAGVFSDKNQAGLHYAVGAFIALVIYRQPRARVFITGLSGVVLWLTQSRTAMAAFAVGVLWVFVARRLALFFRLLLAALLVFGVNLAEERLALVGAFADRAGSDALRHRIDEAAAQLISATPWYGRGWGQGTVELQGSTWFFHNAFEVMRVEGGWPLLISSVLCSLWIGTRVLKVREVSTERVICQAATFTLFICAWKLGDTFFTVAWGAAMAVGLRLWILESGGRAYNPGPRRGQIGRNHHAP